MKARIEVVATEIGVRVQHKSGYQAEKRADCDHNGDGLSRVLRMLKRIHDRAKPVDGDYQNQNVAQQTDEENGIAYEVASRHSEHPIPSHQRDEMGEVRDEPVDDVKDGEKHVQHYVALVKGLLRYHNDGEENIYHRSSDERHY